MWPLSISNQPEVKDMLIQRETLDDSLHNIQFCLEEGCFDCQSKEKLQKLSFKIQLQIGLLDEDLMLAYSRISMQQVWEHEEMNAPEKITINKDSN